MTSLANAAAAGKMVLTLSINRQRGTLLGLAIGAAYNWRTTIMESKIVSAIHQELEPVALIWSDEKPEGAMEFVPGKWGCILFLLATAAKGQTAVASRETFGCFGGGVVRVAASAEGSGSVLAQLLSGVVHSPERRRARTAELTRRRCQVWVSCGCYRHSYSRWGWDCSSSVSPRVLRRHQRPGMISPPLSRPMTTGPGGVGPTAIISRHGAKNRRCTGARQIM